jgi:hypothetical protein
MNSLAKDLKSVYTVCNPEVPLQADDPRYTDMNLKARMSKPFPCIKKL